MEESVFSKIIKGEIPCHKVYEDDKTLAFLDIHPVQPGQVVIVPKVQVNFIWDLAAEDYQALMNTVQKVGRHLKKQLPEKNRIGVRIEGFDIDNHAHVVLIPANDPSEFNAHPLGGEPDHEALAKLAKELKI